MHADQESMHGAAIDAAPIQVPSWRQFGLQMQPMRAQIPHAAQTAQAQEDVTRLHQDLPLSLLRGTLY